MGGSENEGDQAEKNGEREVEALAGREEGKGLHSQRGSAGREDRLDDESEEEEKKKGTNSRPGGLPARVREAVECRQEKIDDAHLRCGPTEQGEAREEESGEKTDPRVHPMPRGGAGKVPAPGQVTGVRHENILLPNFPVAKNSAALWA